VFAACAAGFGVSPSAASTSRIAALRLTTSERYDAIAVVNGRIIVYGPASPSPEFPSTSSTCSSAFVNPSTLALSNRRSGNCADPAIFERSVIPAISIDRNLPAASGGPNAIVRIARVTSVSPGYALGPVVMSFPALAYGDTKPSWIYGGGDLWLYDWVNHFDLLRISATTGAVLQRLVVPKIQSPLLAFNEQGLWIAPIGESSGPLYRLAPGASRLTPVFDLGPGGFAWWLIASGDSVWIDKQPRPVSKPATVWELRGPDAIPVWHEAQNPKLRTVVEQVPLDSPSMVVGNGSDGLWTVVVSPSGSPSGLQQQVSRIDPRTGKLAPVATLTSAYPQEEPSPSVSMLESWQATTFEGSLFILDPTTPVPPTTPAPEAAIEAGGFLYRVTPSGL
jgi:hypothetical protein